MFVFQRGEWRWLPIALCSIEGEGDEGDNGAGAGDGGGKAAGDDGAAAGGGSDNSGGGAGEGEGGEQGSSKARLGKSGGGIHGALGKSAEGEGEGGEGDGGEGSEGEGGDKANGQDKGQKGAAYTLREDGTLSVKDTPAWWPKDHVNEDGTLDLKGMADRLAGFRKDRSTGKDKAIADPAEFKFELPEAFKDREDTVFPEGADKDPLLNWFRQEAAELGMSQDQFQDTVAKFIEKRAEQLPKPIDGKAELEALGPNGAATVAFFYDYFNGLADQGTMNEEDMQEAEIMLMTATGVRFMSKLFEAMGENLGEKRIAHIPATVKGAKSRGELEAEQAKWEAELAKGNPEAEAKLAANAKEWEKLYGTDPAGSSTIG